MLMREKILVVATPLSIAGGGSLRALRSVEEYSKYFDVHLFLPYGATRYNISSELLRSFIRSGITVAGFSKLPKVAKLLDYVLGERIPRTLTNFIFTPIAGPRLLIQSNYKCTVSLHEDVDAVYASHTLSRLLNVPAICLLQLPPFYGSKQRLHNIMKAHILWRRSLMVSSLAQLLSAVETAAEYSIVDNARKRMYEHVLQRHNAVIAVSRSIPYEMGGEWINRVYALDPGVSLDEEDLRAIERIRAKTKEKDRYIVFGGRPIAVKGVVEALIAFKIISKRLSDVRLVFTGGIKEATLGRLKHLCRKLGIEDRILFTGFLPRDKRFEVVAKAMLMIYPSHADSFSYAVLESLHLGTPVVGYGIPALEIYYSRSPGIRLVREWDLEALTAEAMDVLEKGVEAVEPPKIPSWKEVMNKEVTIIRKVIVGTNT